MFLYIFFFIDKINKFIFYLIREQNKDTSKIIRMIFFNCNPSNLVREIFFSKIHLI
jgi:hypothetical protein